jgi:hypothetical protein
VVHLAAIPGARPSPPTSRPSRHGRRRASRSTASSRATASSGRGQAVRRRRRNGSDNAGGT